MHALPVLDYIAAQNPAAQIDWLVEEAFAPILQEHPLVHQVIRVQTRKWRQLSLTSQFRAFNSFRRDLRQKKYDYVFDLQGNSKSGLFTLFSRGQHKYGFSRVDVREWPNILATRHRVKLNHDQQQVTRRALALVKAAFPGGEDAPLCGSLPVNSEAEAAVRLRLHTLGAGEKRIVVLHYGTTWETKLWNLALWQQLALKLSRLANLALVLTWGNDDELTAAKQIQRSTGAEAIIWPRGTLPELVALLACADIVVGCDTGPVHIAAATGTKTVSMYRVTDALRNGPEGSGHIRLQSSMPCAKCLRKKCEYDTQCSTSIRVSDVYDSIEQLLEKENECSPS